MEQSQETEASDKDGQLDFSSSGNSSRVHELQHDPRIELLKKTYSQLSRQLKSTKEQHEAVLGSSDRLCNVFKYISSSYFYESLAKFGPAIREIHFYNSLKLGDRFVAKVTNVFERSADVLLVYSSKRDIADLKVKAYLRLVQSKRYNTGSNDEYRSGKYNRSGNETCNLEVCDIIFVELVYFNKNSHEMEVARCNSLAEEDDPTEEDSNEDEDGLINENKYQAKSPSQVSFHEYMMDHNHLRNPSLLKQPFFSSLLHHNQVVHHYSLMLEKRAETRQRKIDQDNMTRKYKQTKPDDSSNNNHKVECEENRSKRQSSEASSWKHHQTGQIRPPERNSFSSSKYRSSLPHSSRRYYKQNESDSQHNRSQRKRTLSPIEDKNSRYRRYDHDKNRSLSPSSSESDSSSSSSSSNNHSSDYSRKRHNKKHKSRHDEKNKSRYHKKKSHKRHHSSKDYRKSKEKKHYRKHGRHGQNTTRNRLSETVDSEDKKIDHQILKLLNMTG